MVKKKVCITINQNNLSGCYYSAILANNDKKMTRHQANIAFSAGGFLSPQTEIKKTIEAQKLCTRIQMFWPQETKNMDISQTLRRLLITAGLYLPNFNCAVNKWEFVRVTLMTGWLSAQGSVTKINWFIDLLIYWFSTLANRQWAQEIIPKGPHLKIC